MVKSIKVEHQVPFDDGLEAKCYQAGDFYGKEFCPHLRFRDRTHGNKAPVERRVPKCTLFNTWVSGYDKCPECLAHCNKEEN